MLAMKTLKTYGRRYKEDCVSGSAVQRRWSPEVLEIPTKRRVEALFDDLLSEYQSHRMERLQGEKTAHPETEEHQEEDKPACNLFTHHAVPLQECRLKRNKEQILPEKWLPQCMSTPIPTARQKPILGHNSQNISTSNVPHKLSRQMGKKEKENVKPRTAEAVAASPCCSGEKGEGAATRPMCTPTFAASKLVTSLKRKKNAGCPLALRTVLGTSALAMSNDEILLEDSQESVCTLFSSRHVGIGVAEKRRISLGTVPGRRAEKIFVSDAASAVAAVLDFTLVPPVEERPAQIFQDNTVLDARGALLQLCNQSTETSFEEVLKLRGNCCRKLGEGLYGEVFLCKGCVIKIVPVEGGPLVNGEKQKVMLEILPEVVIGMELSSLASANFIHMKRVQLVQGKYHPTLLKAWDAFNKEHKSANDRPDYFDEAQKYVVFEFENGGTCLEDWKINNPSEALSIFLQVACTLAVGEAALEFEHRDLHWGNILISKTSHEDMEYQIGGKTVVVNTAGLAVTVIDYTLSRMKKGRNIIFTDLSLDTALFTGKGDYQFQVYRLMKKNNKNNWEDFKPYSNVLWLHYLAHKLLQGHTKRSEQNDVWQGLHRYARFLLTCSSAEAFVIDYC